MALTIFWISARRLAGVMTSMSEPKDRIWEMSSLLIFTLMAIVVKLVSLLTMRISQGDRYLGMTAAMTQIPVPTANLNGTANHAH